MNSEQVFDFLLSPAVFTIEYFKSGFRKHLGALSLIYLHVLCTSNSIYFFIEYTELYRAFKASY